MAAADGAAPPAKATRPPHGGGPIANKETNASPSGAAFGKRRGVLVAGVVLVLLAIAGRQGWRAASEQLAADPRYAVAPENIDTPPAPRWVRGDLASEVLAVASQHGPLSLLAPPDQLESRLADAFAFHPWVRSVQRIEKLPPNRLRVFLTYRQPLVAVAAAGTFYAADADAVRLPEGDLSEGELRHLPRVTLPTGAGEIGVPLRGESWRDPRVLGAVSIVSRLAADWRGLNLADVAPKPRPEVRGDQQFYLYDLVTTHGTRIVWGAAPWRHPHDEPPFEQKRSRLLAFIEANGSLGSVHSPAIVDVRYQTRVEQRRVDKPAPANDPPPVRK